VRTGVRFRLGGFAPRNTHIALYNAR
jgi:hypothetical protein